MAERSAQGQEDVPAAARPAVRRRSLDDLATDPRGSHAVARTATKLARGLRELRDDADTPAYLGLVSSGTTNPTARVEYALRADDLLSEPQVRQIMEYYLAVRMRRYGRASYQGENGATASDQTAERTPDHALRPTSTVTTSVTSAHPATGSSRPFAGGVETRTTGSAISTIATVRPVARSASREPGRY